MTKWIFAVAAVVLMQATASAQSAPLSVEQRLQRVEDELAIKRILVEYAVRLDAKNLDAYVDLFAENGVWQIGASARTGHAEIRKMLDGLYGNAEKEPFGYQRFRIVTNMQVDIDGDHATARSRHLSIMRGEKGQPTPTLAGLYEDELIRENGEWKILKRVDYPIMPTAAEWQLQLQEMLAKEQK
jgi:ketosteroid isomerase-like protein